MPSRDSSELAAQQARATDPAHRRDIASKNRDEPPAVAIVDGSNVAHSSEGDKPRLRNITLVCEKLREEGLKPIVVVDAALRHQIDDQQGLEKAIDDGEIKQAPAGTDADYFILSFARELDAAVVSNDRFKDRVAAFPEARENAIRYMIVADEVVFERRTKKH